MAVAAAGITVALSCLRAGAAPSYVATPLGTLGGNGSSATAINASGEVTGYSYVVYWQPPYPSPNESMWHAFMYSGGVMRDLGTLGGNSSSGRAINASGQIAGFADLGYVGPQYERHPALFANGTIHDLGTLGGPNASAEGINASGQIVGSSDSLVDSYGRAFLYSNGVMTDLGTLGGPGSSAWGINASGQVAGVAGLPAPPGCGSSISHAFLYSHGSMRDLGSIGDACSTSSGVAINDAGQVTGQFFDVHVGQHAFLWSNGVMQDLGTLGGYSDPFGINSKGDVVGSSVAAGGQGHAFLYTDGTMYDLNQLVTGMAGTLLSIATGINDNGQIVANGCSGSLVCQAFRLDPAPAPGPPAKATAIEYYYPAFDHYFVTASSAEIAALDSGAFPGWARTGQSFDVYSNAMLDTSFVCRFFSTSFGSKSTHFYTSDPGECSIVQQSGAWELEGEVMTIAVPDGAGNCAMGTQPVYRLYNNGQGGAPNHRYTTSLAVRSEMVAQGWVSEGSGDDGVAMCSPN